MTNTFLSYNYTMKLVELVKKQFSGLGKYEKIFFPLIIILTIAISILSNDRKLATISVLCSLCYTLLAGKGKIGCYFTGILGSIIYSYLAFINNLYGSFLLYLGFFVPSQIIGIFKWKKHLYKKTKDVIKTKLKNKERIMYFVFCLSFSCIASILLKKTNDPTPYKDGFILIFSIFGQILTIKRCIEQWYFWFFVNLLSLIVWINLVIQNQKASAFILMWFIYCILAVYFYICWKKELKASN